MTTANKVAFAQCTQRSTGANRSSRDGASGRGSVVSAIRLPDPRVDVVAPVLPVALVRLAGGARAAVQPLARLVAVHRRDVEPDRPAVVAADAVALHVVRDHHVGAAGLLERQALGVRAVEAGEDDTARPG